MASLLERGLQRPDALLDLDTPAPVAAAESGEFLAGGLEALFGRFDVGAGAFEQLDVLGPPRLAGTVVRALSAAF
ncbi:MAG: hypothetical protein WKF40_05445 [Thermoleophilaceae bacterium]